MVLEHCQTPAKPDLVGDPLEDRLIEERIGQRDESVSRGGQLRELDLALVLEDRRGEVDVAHHELHPREPEEHSGDTTEHDELLPVPEGSTNARRVDR